MLSPNRRNKVLDNLKAIANGKLRSLAKAAKRHIPLPLREETSIYSGRNPKGVGAKKLSEREYSLISSIVMHEIISNNFEINQTKLINVNLFF